MNKKQSLVILLALILALFILNYPHLDEKFESFLNSAQTQEVFIERVIDGDTVVSDGTSIRLLGINTPERGERLYEEAKAFLEQEILNETVTLKFTNEKTDKYGRTLAYIFHQNKNVNVELVLNGFANPYFYSGKDIYSEEIIEAWTSCLENNKRLCERSTNVCASCVTLTRNTIINNCNTSCNITGWILKEEGRDKIVLNESSLLSGEVIDFNLDLKNSEGNLFLRGDDELLISSLGY